MFWTLGVVGRLLVCSAAGFQNLGFEEVNEKVLFGQPLRGPSSEVLPGWSLFIDDQLIDTVFLNSMSIEGATTSIFDADASEELARQVPAPAEGRYYLGIGPSFNFETLTYQTVSVVQRGTIPFDVLSLTYVNNGFNIAVLFINGIELHQIVQRSADTGRLYGVDLSPFRGQTVDLRFSVERNRLPTLNLAQLDDITFSVEPIPEPPTWLLGIFVIASLCLLLRARLNK